MTKITTRAERYQNDDAQVTLTARIGNAQLGASEITELLGLLETAYRLPSESPTGAIPMPFYKAREMERLLRASKDLTEALEKNEHRLFELSDWQNRGSTNIDVSHGKISLAHEEAVKKAQTTEQEKTPAHCKVCKKPIAIDVCHNWSNGL